MSFVAPINISVSNKSNKWKYYFVSGFETILQMVFYQWRNTLENIFIVFIHQRFVLVLYDSIDEIDEIWREVAPYILDCNDTLPETQRDKFAKKVKECYIGPGGHWTKQNFDKFTEVKYYFKSS